MRVHPGLERVQKAAAKETEIYQLIRTVHWTTMPSAKRPLLAALLLCVLAPAVSAQTVDIVPALRAGDQFRLQVEHSREDSTRPERNVTATTQISVRVVSATKEGTTLEWQPGTATLDSAAANADPLVVAASAAAGDIVLRISLSPDGEVTGLVNSKEVVAKLQPAIDIVVRALLERVPPEERTTVQAGVMKLLSPQLLIASVMRDVETYFALGGASLDVGEAVEIDLEQPSPFGGDPLPAALWVKADSATADELVVLTRTAYDKDVIVNLTKSLISQAGAPPLTDQELATAMEMIDEARFVIDRRFGIAREIQASRGATVGTQRRLDRWRFRLVEPPRR